MAMPDAMTLHLFLLLVSSHLLLIAADTNPIDLYSLKTLKDNNWENTPPNWVGQDPCGDGWLGIGCNINSRVISIMLPSIGMKGQLTGDLTSLSELQILDLSYNNLTGGLPPSIGSLTKLSNLVLVGCGLSGPIPDSIGLLTELVFLSLNSNSFSGPIPPSFGNLINVIWLDVYDNQLSGTIPVSTVTTPGLDLLVRTKHFHFGKNQLSGSIPPRLFRANMLLLHVLFENNQLVGSIPTTLGLVQSLEVVHLSGNSMIGNVPSNINNLTKLIDLRIADNSLTGPLPNLTGLNSLRYADTSNNSFDVSDVPRWFSTLPSLNTLVLRDNNINGTLDIGSNDRSQLQLIDLQNNSIDAFTTRPGDDNIEIILAGNPYCATGTGTYCTTGQVTNSSYSTPPNNCQPIPCLLNQTSTPNCGCSVPFTGNITFRVPAFPGVGNSTIYTYLEKSLMSFLQPRQPPVDSVSLSNPRKDPSDYLVFKLQLFPSGGDKFNMTGVAQLAFYLSNQTFKLPPQPFYFGPYAFNGEIYENFAAEPTTKGSNKKSNNTGIIIGAAAGGSVLVLLLVFAGIYAFRQKGRADRATAPTNNFASWDSVKNSGSVPQLKGPRVFSFEELKKCTNNFSVANDVGSGGFGKVYRGVLPNGQLIAIKRAQQGSVQGAPEFKSEIELLSRVHHKNVVCLLGFCFEQDEQILVYEYIPNGTLKESLSGKSGIRLDWMKRLKVALGSARGLAYLHELANPPIIHRDIKSNNILLDEELNAKVADFGLSKPMWDSNKGHITTQVKGTMGYLDPEYYMTHQLTEKSDVYSFGVLMLELITARRPIERGTYIVREVKTATDKAKDLYNLHELIDPIILSGSSTLGGFNKFVDMAMDCVQDSATDRPTMGEVVKEIENIMKMSGLNPNAAGSGSTSATYDDSSKDPPHPYNKESLPYGMEYPPPR